MSSANSRHPGATGGSATPDPDNRRRSPPIAVANVRFLFCIVLCFCGLVAQNRLLEGSRVAFWRFWGMADMPEVLQIHANIDVCRFHIDYVFH